ncbi:hypothetical protein C8R44DRAFT_120806 [Mycena epipterygia]|nr:hypothetical protein C8R44DRAFT_120806 [Mycena epipterygia]
MCLCILWLFGHNCWQYYPDLAAIFPYSETRYSLACYLQHFLRSIRRAPTIVEAVVWSVSYCRTRGPSSYPFLIVQLKHIALHARPVVLKLQGFGTVREPGEIWFPYENPEEKSTFTVAGFRQSVRELVGTRRYDVCHTMKCHQCGITDLLVLAELSTERDPTRAVYPATLFLAMESLFNGAVTSSTKRRARAAPLPSDIAKETKDAVIDAFPTRRQRMKEQIDLRMGLHRRTVSGNAH